MIATLCLGLMAIQTTLAMRTKSPTADEFSHHIANGYSYLKTGDFRMNPASPPLPRMLSAMPLLWMNAKTSWEDFSWKTGNSQEFARKFFYVWNDQADDFIFWARVPNVLLSVIFGLVLFFWSRSLFGNTAALGSVMLYGFCPDILAHSGLATADLPVAFFFFLTLVSFYFYLRKPGNALLVATGLFAGLTFLSKFSAVLLLPVLLLVVIFSGKLKSVSPAKVLLFLFICFFTVWAGYFFELKPLLKNTPDPDKKIAVYQKIGGERLVRFAEKTPVPFSTFSSAVVSMAYTRARGTHAYLMGKWSDKGWWYYYFVAFVVKNTIPFLILGVLGIGVSTKLRWDRLTQSILLIPIAFFFIVTFPDKAQAGIRYFLPVYPFFIMLGGLAFAYLWDQKHKAIKGLALLLISWHVAEALWIFPHYLSYFNQLAGGPGNGYRWLRDSNVDWGQDLKNLAAEARKARYSEVVLFYPWPASPEYYKIPYRTFTSEEFKRPKKAVYAISVHFLDGVAWTREFTPSKKIGYSIFIYDHL